MSKYKATVAIEVEIEIDAATFTESFMEEFRSSFYPFFDIEHHITHLAQLEARGLLRDDFIEGYGPPKDMGIKTRILGWETDVISRPRSASPSISEQER